MHVLKDAEDAVRIPLQLSLLLPQKHAISLPVPRQLSLYDSHGPLLLFLGELGDNTVLAQGAECIAPLLCEPRGQTCPVEYVMACGQGDGLVARVHMLEAY